MGFVGGVIKRLSSHWDTRNIRAGALGTAIVLAFLASLGAGALAFPPAVDAQIESEMTSEEFLELCIMRERRLEATREIEESGTTRRRLIDVGPLIRSITEIGKDRESPSAEALAYCQEQQVLNGHLIGVQRGLRQEPYLQAPAQTGPNTWAIFGSGAGPFALVVFLVAVLTASATQERLTTGRKWGAGAFLLGGSLLAWWLISLIAWQLLGTHGALPYLATIILAAPAHLVARMVYRQSGEEATGEETIEDHSRSKPDE